MGHKSGLKKAGAQGLVPALTKSEIDKSFDEGQTIELSRILEFAHGRAAQTVNQKSDSGGLTINILRMSDGETHREVIDAVNVAKEMLESSNP